MCDALEVSASGYYAWASRADSPTEEWRQELVGAIGEVHAEVMVRLRLSGSLGWGSSRR